MIWSTLGECDQHHSVWSHGLYRGHRGVEAGGIVVVGEHFGVHAEIGESVCQQSGEVVAPVVGPGRDRHVGRAVGGHNLDQCERHRLVWRHGAEIESGVLLGRKRR